MEIKDFIFDPDWVDGFRQKFKDFYVGPISTHKNIQLVKIGVVVFPQFCVHTDTHTEAHTHTETKTPHAILYNNVESALVSGSKKYSHLIKNQ